MDITQNQLGYVDESDLRPSAQNTKPLFQPIGIASSLDDCYNIAKTRGTPRFAAYSPSSTNQYDWNCFGGDTTKFDKKSGIATYLIPKPNEDITLTKYQLINENLQKELDQKKAEYNKNQAALFCAKNGLAINGNCQTQYNQYLQQQDKMKQQTEQEKQRQLLEEKQQEIERQYEMQQQLLQEKGKVKIMKEERIKKNDNDLSRLDKKLLTMTQIIKNTQFKYKLNDSMVYILTMFIIAFVVLVLLIVAYNGYYYLKHV